MVLDHLGFHEVSNVEMHVEGMLDNCLRLLVVKLLK